MATDPRQIGTRIAKRRHQLGLTQEELAARLGVSKSTVANWEIGKHYPLRKLGALEQALGVSLSEEDSPPQDPADPMAETRESLRYHVGEVQRLAALLGAADQAGNDDRVA